MTSRPTLYYGWVIVGIGVVVMVLIYGTRHSFSVFFPPILDEFGWSRGSTAFMLSLNLLVYGFTAPIAGSLADRWKPKLVMIIGIIILGLALASCSFSTELWHFYLLFGVLVPIGNAFSGWPLLGPSLVNWFSKRRGLVLGLSMMGSGLSFTYGILIELYISQVGWRHAYFIVAGIIVAILLPLYLFLFHYKPEDKGLRAYGIIEQSSDNKSPENLFTSGDDITPDWTFSQAIRSYRLWLIIISQALYWGIGCYLVLAHQVKFAQDMGYTSTFAASIFALFGVFMATGEVCGFISDWIGRERTILLATITEIIAIVALIFVQDASQPWLFYVYATCFGFGAGLYLPAYFAGVADIFHGKHYGAIAGLSLTGAGIGGVVGPWLGGYIFDTTGSYLSAFFLCIASFILACIAFWVAAPRKGAKVYRS
jgi:sugar phosphate permease